MKTFAPVTYQYKPRPFAVPEDILVDRSLCGWERRRLLDDWKEEIERSIQAAEMSDRDSAQPDELLRRVNACRRILSEQEH